MDCKILFAGALASGFGGVLNLYVAIAALLDGHVATFLSHALVTFPISLALAVVFLHVRDQIAAQNKRAAAAGSQGTGEIGVALSSSQPLSNLAGTPWANNPGHTSDSM